MLKVPSAIAEYTVGTMIVLFHLGVIRPLEERARQQRPASRHDTDDTGNKRRRAATN